MDHLLTKRITDTMHMLLKCMLMPVMMHMQMITEQMHTLKLVMMHMLMPTEQMLTLKLVMMHTLMPTEQMLTMHMQNTFTTNNKTALGVPYT
jgi:hypothetical protein